MSLEGAIFAFLYVFPWLSLSFEWHMVCLCLLTHFSNYGGGGGRLACFIGTLLQLIFSSIGIIRNEVVSWLPYA